MAQLDLFVPRAPTAACVPPIEGLDYREDFISEAVAADLMAAIDRSPWSNEYARRRQQYGRHYGPAGDRGEEAAPLPEWLVPWLRTLVERGLFPKIPQTCLINEYLPGQGIALHVDRPRSGPLVASLTLAAGCTMDFVPVEGDARPERLWLAPRSLLRLSGPARTVWKHGIAKRKTDVVGGRRVPRQRRISVTVRMRDDGRSAIKAH